MRIILFPVSQILNFTEQAEVSDYLIANELLSLEQKDKARFANKTLFRLHKVIHIDTIINSFLETGNSLDRVLNIFIRVNSGGTQLSYSDLLLSIATAQWEDKDAREEITTLVDDLNQIGNGFNFSKDFVLKSCLVLGGFRDIAFRVDNFNRANMKRIEESWDRIREALRGAVLLAASFGYSRDTLTSNNALIPIACYLQSINSPDNFALAGKMRVTQGHLHGCNRPVEGTFGGHADDVLRSMRNAIEKSNGNFP